MNVTVIRRLAAGTALTIAVAVAGAHPSGALPAGFDRAPGGANSNGVGFCLYQVAQDPEGTIDQPSLGAGMHQIATSDPGAVPSGISGDRYPTCGGPGATE